MSKLSEAASQVTNLVGPEPALMHCLRAQMEAHRENVVTSVEIEEFTMELPAGDALTLSRQPTIIQEEISSVTIVEETSTPTEGDQPPEGVTTQEEISSIIVEAESTLTEKQEDQFSTLSVPLQFPTSTDSKIDAPVKDGDQIDLNVNQESTNSQDETVKITPPASPTASTINLSPTISNSPASSTASNSCSDNTQFIGNRSPVYA